MDSVQVLVIGAIEACEPVEIAFNQVRHAQALTGGVFSLRIIP